MKQLAFLLVAMLVGCSAPTIDVPPYPNTIHVDSWAMELGPAAPTLIPVDLDEEQVMALIAAHRQVITTLLSKLHILQTAIRTLSGENK